MLSDSALAYVLAGQLLDDHYLHLGVISAMTCSLED